MARIKELIISFTLTLLVHHALCFGEPGTIDHQWGSFNDELPTEFGPPCPLNFSAAPCECTGHSKNRNLDCSLATDATDITQMLLAYERGLAFAQLKIQNCNLTNLLGYGFTYNNNFTTFYIVNCPIEDMAYHLFIGSQHTAKHITMKNLLLNEFPFSALNGYSLLEYLDLSNNRLTQFQSFQNLQTHGQPAFGDIGLPNLRELILKGNQFFTIEPYTFKNLPHLEMLDLSENNLTSLGANAFSNPNMKDIVVVHLITNYISQIHKDAFANLSLSSVHFEDNKLEYIPREVLEPLLDHLVTIDATFYLLGNPFNCNTTTVKWLLEKSLSEKRHLRDWTCQNGKQLEGLTLQDLENADKN